MLSKIGMPEAGKFWICKIYSAGILNIRMIRFKKRKAIFAEHEFSIEKDKLQKCSIELPDVEECDATKIDSSNAAWS